MLACTNKVGLHCGSSDLCRLDRRVSLVEVNAERNKRHWREERSCHSPSVATGDHISSHVVSQLRTHLSACFNLPSLVLERLIQDQ
jgi:hypothetical protein